MAGSLWNLEVTSDGTYSVGGKPGSITEALKDGIFMDVICGTGPVSNTVFCTTSNGILCAFHESRLMDKWLQLESNNRPYGVDANVQTDDIDLLHTPLRSPNLDSESSSSDEF